MVRESDFLSNLGGQEVHGNVCVFAVVVFVALGLIKLQVVDLCALCG